MPRATPHQEPGCLVEVTALALPGAGPELELLRAHDGATSDDLRRVTRERSARLGADRRVSRSYSHPYALLAHHDQAVGIDVERIQPCDVVFAASICTPSELESLRVLDWAQVVSLWSSKEAFAKALGDARLYDRRRLDGPAGWEHGRSGPWRAQAVDVGTDYRAWVCWRGAAGDGGGVIPSATRARLRSASTIAGP